MQRWGISMQLGMARKCWGDGQRDKREKHGRRGCGEAGGQYVMWEEDTENEDMVKQVGDSCIAVQYVCGAVENSMQLGTTRG